MSASRDKKPKKKYFFTFHYSFFVIHYSFCFF